MKKIVYSVLVLVLLLSACTTPGAEVTPTPEPTAPASVEINGVTYLPLEDAVKTANIQMERRDDEIHLTEKGIEIVLRIGQPYLYRRGYVVAVLPGTPALQDGAVYLPETLCGELLGDGTLFNDILFFKDEVADALDAPDKEPGKSVLAAVELPRSMDISIPNLDTRRIFEEKPLSEYPAVLADELGSMGIKDAQNCAYSEYLVLTEARTVAEAGLEKYFLAYEELQGEDPSAWTVRQYNAWEQAHTLAEQGAALTDEQRAFLEEKNIRIEDLHWLRKDYYDSYPEYSDEELRETIEGYYQMVLNSVTGP